MNTNRRQYGFSLTETLMAVGTLAIGMLFVGGTFMTGIYFATVSTERTIASVVADEAFAKIRLYDAALNVAGLSATDFMLYDDATIPDDEFLYPSTGQRVPGQYSWSALCRREGAGSHTVQCVVFVCRQTGISNRPEPVRLDVQSVSGSEVRIVDPVAAAGVRDGASIVDDATGRIYRVLERLADRPDTIRLDRAWTGGSTGRIWVVPPPVAGGRNPLIGVYQRTLRMPGSVVPGPT